MFFFFKQKTAYELRISDWSSDVCSSDLAAPGPCRVPKHHRHEMRPREGRGETRGKVGRIAEARVIGRVPEAEADRHALRAQVIQTGADQRAADPPPLPSGHDRYRRDPRGGQRRVGGLPVYPAAPHTPSKPPQTR